MRTAFALFVACIAPSQALTVGSLAATRVMCAPTTARAPQPTMGLVEWLSDFFYESQIRPAVRRCVPLMPLVTTKLMPSGRP